MCNMLINKLSNVLKRNILHFKWPFRICKFFWGKDFILDVINNSIDTDTKIMQKRLAEWEKFAKHVKKLHESRVPRSDHITLNEPLFFSTIEKNFTYTGRVYTNRNIVQFYMPSTASPFSYEEINHGKTELFGIVPEDGGAIVFQQFHTGEVGVIMCPAMLKFENDQRRKARLLKIYKAPSAISDADILFYFYKCILYGHETSYRGNMTLASIAQQFWLDNKVSVIFLVIGTVLGAIFGYLLSKIG